jgi:hypothetical protein
MVHDHESIKLLGNPSYTLDSDVYVSSLRGWPREARRLPTALWTSSEGFKAGSDHHMWSPCGHATGNPCGGLVRTMVMNSPPLGGWLLASEDSYLVDPASSHMLVSKIKPCMSKYKQLYGETANGSLNQL